MSIKVACQCGKRFVAPPHLAGKSVNCPNCGSAIVIAAPPAPPPTRPTLAAPAPPQGAGTSPAEEGIVVSCVCGQRFNAPSHLAGQQLPCPVCRQPILIPTGNSGLEPWSTPSLPPAGNDLWSELPAHQSLPSFHAQTPQQASWSSPQQQASPHTALANQYMANAYHQDVEKRQDLDAWGTGKIYSGIITMAIAAIWFCSGLAFGIIFFFPPVMFIGGAIALINGLSQKMNRD